MKLDVFYCTAATQPIRYDMDNLCFTRWSQEKDINLHRLRPKDIECSAKQFQRNRRMYADKHADSSVYVVADDDCLLGSVSPIAAMVGLMERYPEFGILSLMPQNAFIVPWTPESYRPVMDDDVWEHVSVGGIRFCRKGLMTEWPVLGGPWYDGTQAHHLRQEGKRVGYAINLKMNHLGEGYTTLG